MSFCKVNWFSIRWPLKKIGRAWRDQGKRDEARELLASVDGWFTDGFDTLDLKEAKVLHDELTARLSKPATSVDGTSPISSIPLSRQLLGR
jgi:hypothetical protein